MRIPLPMRRTTVLSMYGAYIAGAIMQWRVTTIGENRQVILTVFLFAAAVGILLFAGAHYMRWIGSKESALDEREVAVRNGVYRSAYSIIAWASVGLLIWWCIGPLVSHPLTSDTNTNVLFWGYVLLVSTLPAALLAWKDRAPD